MFYCLVKTVSNFYVLGNTSSRKECPHGWIYIFDGNRRRIWLNMSITVPYIYLYIISSTTLCQTLPKDFIFVSVGHRVVLSCNIAGQSVSYWEIEENVVYVNRILSSQKFERSISLSNNYSLVIKAAEFDNEGIYRCVHGNTTVAIYNVIIQGLYRQYLFVRI